MILNPFVFSFVFIRAICDKRRATTNQQVIFVLISHLINVKSSARAASMEYLGNRILIAEFNGVEMIRKWTTTLLFQPKDLQLHCHVIRQFSVVVVVCLSFGDPKIDCLLQAAGKCLFFPIGPDPTYTYCSPINLLLRLLCVLFPATQNEALIFTTNRPS